MTWSEAAVAENGWWTTHLPLAWRALADPSGNHLLPHRPRAEEPAGAETVGWWGPLFHLLCFGLGWPRPDIGLVRWCNAGRPVDDARLALMERWWSDELPAAARWAANSLAVMNLAREVSDQIGVGTPLTSILQLGLRIPEAPTGYPWGAGDPLHLWFHSTSPVLEVAPGELVIGNPPSGTRQGRAVLLVDTYAGWYRELHRLGASLETRPGARSWRVDVVCRPLGWLGTYRRSRQSGRWFAGRHRSHEMGLVPA